MPILVLGVDPGQLGAAALLECRPGRDRPLLVATCDLTPDLGAFTRLVGRAELIALETQTASPQMGVTSAFRLGQAMGRLEGVLEALKGEGAATWIRPGVWKASYGLPGGVAGKSYSLGMAEQLLGNKAELFRHDVAEAVLIGWWAWRHHGLKAQGVARVV